MSDDPSTRDSVQPLTTTANVTQVAVEEFASIIRPQLWLTQTATEEWAMVVTLLTTSAQMNGQSDVEPTGATYQIASPAAMDGQANVAVTGRTLFLGAAHMDGLAQFLGLTVVTASGAAQMDGNSFMDAAGAATANGDARMDGVAQGEFDSADMVKGAAQMDGKGAFVPQTDPGAAIFESDGQADVLFMSPHHLKAVVTDKVIGGQSTSVKMTYVVRMPQTFVTGEILRPKVRYHLVLSNLINWTSALSFKMKFLTTLREVTIVVTPTAALHSLFHYTMNFAMNFGGTPSIKFKMGPVLTQNLTVHLAASPKFIWGRALTQALTVGDTLISHSTYKALLAQLLKLSELEGFKLSHGAILNQNINLSQLLKGGLSLQLLQKLLVSATASTGIRYHLGLTGGVKLGDILDKLAFAYLTELLTVHGTPTHAFTAIGALNQLLTIHPAFTSKLILQLTGNIQVSQDQLVHMLYNGDALLDGVVIDALFISPYGTTTAWAVNTRTNAVTEYLNYNFNSYALLNNRYVAAGAEGLYELDGDTDDGALIISDLMGGYLQLNDKKMFGIKGAYVAIRGGGRFYLKLIAGDGREYVYELRAQPNLMTTKVKVGKGINTTYMAWELITEGQDFDLDSIEFIPMTRGRRV